MQTIKLNNGIEMPVLGYGVFQVSPEECERCVLDAISTGYRLIDTAQAYYNEEGVGNAVARCGVPRNELFLTTKIWISNAGETNAARSIDESLRKLHTDYIDLLLIHQPFSDSPGTWRAMEKAVKDGKVRAIGLSNFLPASVSRKGEELSILFPEGSYRVGMTNLRPDLEDGTQVLVAVRPEEFEMRSTELEGIPAVVRSSIFLGNTTHYFLELGDGSEVEAIQDSDVWEIIPNGTAVRLGVKEKKINVFSRDGSTPLVVREELL